MEKGLTIIRLFLGKVAFNKKTPPQVQGRELKGDIIKPPEPL